ncbi:MAG: helix-turn-helix domain-containing protein [Tannerella sp.]|jgi:transcriptional regulator with XRE-family HTH domain|nr:helix-turn-helix domain-containing protein [Tannerella sp.]
MNERVSKIMQVKGLNLTQFASATDINPATLSNISSGKTNPSTEVITKILEKFSDINSDWLLLGKGEMLRTGGKTLSASDNQLGLAFESKTNERETVNKMPEISKNTESKEVIYIEKPVRTIDKLMVFYSDKSFETFVMEK